MAILNIVLQSYYSGKSSKEIEMLAKQIFRKAQFRKAISKYKGNVSKTLIVRVPDHIGKDTKFIEKVCIMLGQESIAVKVKDKGQLIFNPTIQTETIQFDDKYFIPSLAV